MAASFLTISRPASFACPPSTSPTPTTKHSHRLSGFRPKALRVSATAKKWDPSKVVPQADRVLVRLEEVQQKSAGGVLLPKSAVKFERYLMGEVLAVGAEAEGLEAGKKVDLGTDARHCFCRAGDLLAMVE